jgi:hypothetical protein
MSEKNALTDIGASGSRLSHPQTTVTIAVKPRK